VAAAAPAFTLSPRRSHTFPEWIFVIWQSPVAVINTINFLIVLIHFLCLLLLQYLLKLPDLHRNYLSWEERWKTWENKEKRGSITKYHLTLEHL
jgi:hypothetical protein